MKLHEYFEEWIQTYKTGTIRDVTMQKYQMAHRRIKELAPDLEMKDLNRITYQKLINDYAKTHERQTVTDFHHLIKSSIIDAVDDGVIERDPTRKVVIKGKTPGRKKKKFLSKEQLKALLDSLELGDVPDRNYMILIMAKTGVRFAELLGLTPEDFDFKNMQIRINKTWDYKSDTGFAPTKNASSVRKIQMDWKFAIQMQNVLENLPKEEPIFIKKGEKIYNSTINDFLERKCKKLCLPVITAHGLRHTHASVLLYSGVSVAGVAKRLGHSNMSTTQKVYLHIIEELDAKDNNIVMSSLSMM